MATTISPRRPGRTQEEWDELARSEILPAIQAGAGMGEIRRRFGSGSHIFAALARLGYDKHGEPFQLRPIRAPRPSILADRVAKRREAGEPWWQIEQEAEKPAAELKELLRKYGHEGLVGHIAAPVSNGQ